MRLDEIINTHRQSLNDTDMVIWKYILQHREVARHISIHELAKSCCVSSTTIVRFAQKLGLDGFGELKAILKMEEAEPPRYSSNVLEDLSDFYLKTGEKIFKRNFDSASRLIHEANRVFTFASGYVQSNVLQELKRLFFYDNVFLYEVPAREEFYSVLETLTKDDLFIVVSLSGETPAVVESPRTAAARHLADLHHEASRQHAREPFDGQSLHLAGRVPALRCRGRQAHLLQVDDAVLHAHRGLVRQIPHVRTSIEREKHSVNNIKKEFLQNLAAPRLYQDTPYVPWYTKGDMCPKAAKLLRSRPFFCIL